MPASSHGLPTSGTRVTSAAALLAADLDRVDPGPVRRVALERRPSLRPPSLKLLAPADDLEMLAVAADPDRQGQAPEALLGDHPVAHVAEPVHARGLRRPAGIHLTVGDQLPGSRSRQSMPMNHSSTRRKSSSVLQRQQCG